VISDDSWFNHEIGRRYRQFPTEALMREIYGNFAIKRFRNEALERNMAKACAMAASRLDPRVQSSSLETGAAPCRDIPAPKKS
jgi:hypothetical protein